MNVLKGGASSTLFNHSRPNKVNKSKFDLSRIVNLTADAGMIVPFDFFEVLPGDVVNLSNAYALDTLPLVQSPLTRYKVIVHWYYMKARDLWKGAKTQATKGRTGNIELATPKVDLLYKIIDGFNEEILPVSHHSLSAFLGVPPKFSGEANKDGLVKSDYFPYTTVPTDTSSAKYKAILTGFKQYRYVNALPFMMYQSIVKNNYVNSNLLVGNKALFPDEGDDDWLLPYDATITNFVGLSKNPDVLTSDYVVDSVYSSKDKVIRLDQLRYSQFDDDYFTTALPWLQRGDVKTLQGSGSINPSDLNSLFSNADYTVNTDDVVISYVEGDRETVQAGSLSGSSYLTTPTQSGTDMLRAALSKIRVSSSSAFSSSLGVNLGLTANQLRELIALSVWQERNSRVDGSYNSLIYQHWAVNPNSEEHLPVYMGGFVDYINYSTILQNSESTSNSPLGSTAGRGSSSGSSKINDSFHCSDYGYCMGILQIKPDTSYMQGVEHVLSCKNAFEDIPFPEFESLSPEPILNKEIYVSENDSIDNGLFGYQERMTYLKVRQNVNRGLFQMKPDKDYLFGSFTQARWFTSLPKLSYQFLCMCPLNMRRDFLAFPKYPAFRLQFLTNCFVVRGLSYTSEPETFGF